VHGRKEIGRASTPWQEISIDLLDRLSRSELCELWIPSLPSAVVPFRKSSPGRHRRHRRYDGRGGADAAAGGFVDYNGKLEVHNSLLNVVLHDKPEIRARE
jgi:hypothetical protein